MLTFSPHRESGPNPTSEFLVAASWFRPDRDLHFVESSVSISCKAYHERRLSPIPAIRTWIARSWLTAADRVSPQKLLADPATVYPPPVGNGNRGGNTAEAEYPLVFTADVGSSFRHKLVAASPRWALSVPPL